MKEYETLYSEFIKNYSVGTTTGEEAGLLVARLAGYYPNFSATLAKSERAYALVCRDEILKTEETTGKQVSATKAQTMADASSEAFAFKDAKMHVTNLEVLIASAKALQRGLIQEMSHANL